MELDMSKSKNMGTGRLIRTLEDLYFDLRREKVKTGNKFDFRYKLERKLVALFEAIQVLKMLEYEEKEGISKETTDTSDLLHAIDLE